MIYQGEEAEKRAVMAAADLMAAAAKTAPKGSGRDNVVTLILDGDDKDLLSSHMRRIADEIGADFFHRDAANVDNSCCIVMIGVIDNPLALDNCSLCGFENCAKMKEAGTNCVFNISDLGIAVGSAVSIAADHRIDNRVLYSAGKAALKMGCFPESVKVCYGIPLSTNSKSIYFDRDPANVMV